jgi:hypothetical protein
MYPIGFSLMSASEGDCEYQDFRPNDVQEFGLRHMYVHVKTRENEEYQSIGVDWIRPDCDPCGMWSL